MGRQSIMEYDASYTDFVEICQDFKQYEYLVGYFDFSISLINFSNTIMS